MPPVVNLPPAQPPEPVSADLFAPKQPAPAVEAKPVVAAVLAVAIVGERMQPSGWLGAVLVISCLVFVTLPVRPRAVRRAEAAAGE